MSKRGSIDWNLVAVLGPRRGTNRMGCPQRDHEAACLAVNREDAAFIAHARSDVPALVSEVRKLRAALEQVRIATAPATESTAPRVDRAYDVACKALDGGGE